MFSKTILQPLDLIRTRLQTQDAAVAGSRVYKGMGHALVEIVRNEGVGSLYRGLFPNLLGSAVSWGCYFYTYNLAKKLKGGAEGKKLNAIDHLQCAAAAGVASAFLTNPIWMVKTRVQIQKTTGKPASAASIALDIVRREGFFALYRGIGPALWLVSNGALQFMAYEQLKMFAIARLVDSEKELHSSHFLVMGAASKTFSTLITYPLQVTKARLYQKVEETGLPKYKGVLDVWNHTIRHQGARGFYSGLIPHLMKTAPASALTFFAYENVYRFLQKFDQSN
jgi:solute carrier family 25 folate transporter 32